MENSRIYFFLSPSPAMVPFGDNNLMKLGRDFDIKHDENPKITKDYYMRIYKNCKHNCAKLMSKNRDYGSY